MGSGSRPLSSRAPLAPELRSPLYCGPMTVKKGAGSEKPKKRAAPQARRAPRKANAVRAKAPRAKKPVAEPVVPSEIALTEEEQIERAKFSPVPPRRLFEEERFLFPETYGQDRIRLLVRDPRWLFVHFDVNPATLVDLAHELGQRTLALSRLALRVSDPSNGGTSLILLPPGAKSWYVKVDGLRRSYRAELGLLMPSGVFRRLAESNTVETPRRGPSTEPAGKRASWRATGEENSVPTPERHAPPSSPLPPWVPGKEEATGTFSNASGGASDIYHR